MIRKIRRRFISTNRIHPNTPDRRHAIWCWKRNRADNIAQSKPSCLAIQILFFAPQYDEELTQTVSSSFIKFIIFLLPYEMKIIIPYIFLTALTLCRMEFKKTVKDT